jgi:ubiquinone/menaquinone biosynthesis C-methylase UbiE
MLTFLAPIRERVLDNAAVSDGDTLLDVGSGDGLIAFGALDRVAPSGTVIFNDISQDLLDHSRDFAKTAGILQRCRFIQGSAAELSAIGDESVDAVTTRSVLIYLPADEKARAIREFHRVLKPGGRISLFEPINRFGHPEPEHRFRGYDTTPVADLAARVRQAAEAGRTLNEHPLLDFDERDLVAWAERAGFEEVHLDYRAEIIPQGLFEDWNAFLHVAGNPLDPTMAEAMAEAVSTAEAERFSAHLRPLVERRQGIQRAAQSYLWATKRGRVA